MEQNNEWTEGNSAFITFSYDDAKQDNYGIALPLHEKYGIGATFAVIAGRALDPSEWRRHMTPYQIADAANRGVEISSHGMLHKKRFTELDDQELATELDESKMVLEGILGPGNEVNSICVPFSRTDSRVRKRAAETYQIVRVHGGKLNDPDEQQSAIVYSHGLHRDSEFEEIQSVIDEAVREKAWLVLMLHGVKNREGESKMGKYDIKESLLDQILAYVSGLGRDVIRPINYNQMIERRKKVNPPAKFNTPVIDKPGAFVLASSSGFRITYHKNEQPSDIVMITFGGLPSKISSKGFGSNFALAVGYDHIFVAQAEGSQYQLLSLEDFYRAVAPYVDGKTVVTYGSSLGAYAALYYGGILNARIIAAAPKNSAHPSMRKAKFENVEFRHAEIAENPVSSNPPLLLFDPLREEETEFIRNAVEPAYPGAIRFEMPFAGHTVLATLKESGILKHFITTYVETGVAPEVSLREEDSFIWHAEKGRWFFKREEFQEALTHYQKSIQFRDNAEAAGGLVKTFAKLGELDQAKRFALDYYRRTGTLKGITKYWQKKLGINVSDLKERGQQ